MTVRLVDLGAVDSPVRLHLPTGRFGLPHATPGVCASWDKPVPVDLTRLSGLDLEDCAWLVRSIEGVPLTVSSASIKALASARIICAGTNETFTNVEELLAADIIVVEGLDLSQLPRVGFTLTVNTSVHAHVRDIGWTE